MLVRRDPKPKLLLILLVFFGLFGIVFLRLFFIQIYNYDFFQSLARQQYDMEITTHPPRALIYDRYGEPLVINRSSVSAFVLPRQLQDADRTKRILKKYFPQVYEKMCKEKERHFFWLERRLSDQRVEQIKAYNCPDICFFEDPERFYPFSFAAHVVGFTDIDNIGIAGIELYSNRRLGGIPTTFLFEKDARSGYFYFHQHVKEQGAAGEPVSLTLDRNLQFFATDELQKTIDDHASRGGAVLIMDPDTGHVLAMANNPGFDPNLHHITNLEQTKNIIVTECFELGSVVKIFTALAALEEGVVTFDEEIDCEGKETHIDGLHIVNWKSLGSGLHPFHTVIAQSNNVGTAKVAKRLGPKLYEHLRRLGFGYATGIQFPGERSGFVNPPANWSRFSVLVMSFGYEMMATLLQLGCAFSLIANGGYKVKPVLFLQPPEVGQARGSALYHEKSLEQVKKILELDGYAKELYSIPGYRLMGKTGTARSLIDGRYSDKEHIFTYGGIVERGNYRRIVVAFIKGAKEKHLLAGEIALPLFHRIAKRMIVYELGKGVI